MLALPMAMPIILIRKPTIRFVILVINSARNMDYPLLKIKEKKKVSHIKNIKNEKEERVGKHSSNTLLIMLLRELMIGKIFLD